eukprot:1374163-Lingulodinium_polyedra.AAC.1
MSSGSGPSCSPRRRGPDRRHWRVPENACIAPPVQGDKVTRVSVMHCPAAAAVPTRSSGTRSCARRRAWT